MDKRYQVFISSTYEDLHEERREVMQALLALDCIPTGMELFPAADYDSWTHIKRFIAGCDYYVVIVGGRYGSRGPTGKSYTEMEYDYAVEAGLPALAFLHKDPGTIPANKTEPTDDGKVALCAFRKKGRKLTTREVLELLRGARRNGHTLHGFADEDQAASGLGARRPQIGRASCRESG